MKLLAELLPGCYLLKADSFFDNRGGFIKTLHQPTFSDFGFSFEVSEEYYTISSKGVVRGMHFQVPPSDHQKVVYCINGWVKDVLLDLRKGAQYGNHCSVDLKSSEFQVLLIPKGIAHGFYSMTDDSTMVYKTSTVHDPSNDRGIRWDSFGYNWGLSEKPIISSRDLAHPVFESFISPF